jgi:ribosomal protein L11 methyltransferase
MMTPLVRTVGTREHILRAAVAYEAADAFADVPVASFESAEGQWTLEAYGGPGDDAEELRAVADRALQAADLPLRTEIHFIEQRDWVAASLEGLAPVRAGRVVVHGSHDRGRVPANAIGIEIEAALAFGTGHHGTTAGCLLALQDVLKRRRPRTALDLGTGSGVLAIALARLTHGPVLATDIDSVAVTSARANARANGAGSLVQAVRAAGLGHSALRNGARFDLILANILAEPLVTMATGIAERLAPGGTVILSGLLVREERRVRGAYLARGLRFRSRRELGGWMTLIFERA